MKKLLVSKKKKQCLMRLWRMVDLGKGQLEIMVYKQLSETVKLLSVVFLMETEISGSIWKYFKISGRYLEILGNIWKYLKMVKHRSSTVIKNYPGS